MSYNYAAERTVVFTEEGVKNVIVVRDFIRRSIDTCGAVTAGKAMNQVDGLGDSFAMMAIVDYLIERGEFRVHGPDNEIAWQLRVLVKA